MAPVCKVQGASYDVSSKFAGLHFSASNTYQSSQSYQSSANFAVSLSKVGRRGGDGRQDSARVWNGRQGSVKIWNRQQGVR